MAKYQPQAEEPDSIEGVAPEANLIAAVVRRAWLDALGAGTWKAGKDTKDAAIEWIMREDAVSDPFTFEWCCNAIFTEGLCMAKKIRASVTEKNLPTEFQKWQRLKDSHSTTCSRLSVTDWNPAEYQISSKGGRDGK